MKCSASSPTSSRRSLNEGTSIGKTLSRIIEVEAETACPGSGQKVAIGGSDQAHLDRARALVPHPFQIVLLQDAQQLALQVERDFSDFVEDSVPSSANSKRPTRSFIAPVNAPRTWPKTHSQTAPLGIEAQFTRTSGRPLRALKSWIARATSSLPLPDSPRIMTLASVGATVAIWARTF